jgi:hypothetical protein
MNIDNNIGCEIKIHEKIALVMIFPQFIQYESKSLFFIGIIIGIIFKLKKLNG